MFSGVLPYTHETCTVKLGPPQEGAEVRRPLSVSVVVLQSVVGLVVGVGAPGGGQDRHLLAVGGCDDVFGRAETQPTAELFDPRIGVWQAPLPPWRRPLRWRSGTAGVCRVSGGIVARHDPIAGGVRRSIKTWDADGTHLCVVPQPLAGAAPEQRSQALSPARKSGAPERRERASVAPTAPARAASLCTAPAVSEGW